MPLAQVLDVALRVADRGPTFNTTTIEQTGASPMDPAALGTLLIGLDAIQTDQSDDGRRRRSNHPAVTRRSYRVELATMLRTIADRLERQATQPAAG